MLWMSKQDLDNLVIMAIGRSNLSSSGNFDGYGFLDLHKEDIFVLEIRSRDCKFKV